MYTLSCLDKQSADRVICWRGWLYTSQLSGRLATNTGKNSITQHNETIQNRQLSVRIPLTLTGTRRRDVVPALAGRGGLTLPLSDDRSTVDWRASSETWIRGATEGLSWPADDGRSIVQSLQEHQTDCWTPGCFNVDQLVQLQPASVRRCGKTLGATDTRSSATQWQQCLHTNTTDSQ